MKLTVGARLARQVVATEATLPGGRLEIVSEHDSLGCDKTPTRYREFIESVNHRWVLNDYLTGMTFF